tara:strand:- start:139 stop:510 length:372 start_codon:yes stop_codon:yes gene_type:complete
MKNFKRNYKRNRYRNNGEKNYQKNGGVQKLNSDIANGFSFRRINQNRNNQNATKLAEKYTTLAKEALTNGDKILYENYLQHADHFTRIYEEKENNKIVAEKSTEEKSLETKSKIDEKFSNVDE